MDKNFPQKFNYHTHTRRSGHSELCTDEEMLVAARRSGITSLGFTEHVPNSPLDFPEETHRMLNSEIFEYLASINTLKDKYYDMDILVGYEAEYDPIKEAYLGKLRDNADYMILGQHFIEGTRGEANLDYPLIYAKRVCDALDSGLFDIIAHPDIFMRYRPTIKEKDLELYDKYCIEASRLICEKAASMNIPIEINLGPAEDIVLNRKRAKLGLIYPQPLFWKVASQFEGLKVLIGVDAHWQDDFKIIQQSSEIVSDITDLVRDKLLEDGYNPKKARENNPILQSLYIERQKQALSLEAAWLRRRLDNIDKAYETEDNLSPEELAKHYASHLKFYYHNLAMKDKEKKDSLEVDDRGIKENTDTVLHFQQSVIDRGKNAIPEAISIGCTTKEECKDIATRIMDARTNPYHHLSSKQEIDQFVRSKSIDTTPPKELKKTSGYVSTLSLQITIYIGILSMITYIILSILIK